MIEWIERVLTVANQLVHIVIQLLMLLVLQLVLHTHW